MVKFIENLENDLKSRLLFLNTQDDNPLKRTEVAILEVKDVLKTLKSFVLRNGFLSEKEEIDFFKNRKPMIMSQLIYYNDIFRIETRKPSGGEKILRKYYREELSRLNEFFEDNVDFYRYYRTKSNCLDHKYFLREKWDVRLSLDSHIFEADPRFSTSHDYKLAKLLANDLLEVHLKKELLNLDHQEVEQPTPLTKLVWSENKTAMIEMIYALHYKGAFNNGNADIKEISTYFEAVFSIHLGDVYRGYVDIKNRAVRTKFLTGLEELLIRRMQDSDE